MVPATHERPVAVMDDDVKFIRMVERMLSTEGIPVQPVTTPDLDDAARVVGMTNCRAALIDIYIYGEAAGFQLIERLRNDPETSGLPLIVTSGAYREIARNVPFLQHHHCSILPKPFDLDALLERLNGIDHGDGGIGSPGEPGNTLALHGAGRRWFVNPLRLFPEHAGPFA